MTRRGPIEDGEWKNAIDATVVDAGPPPRIHGYDLWHDLVPNYSFAEVMLTALCGEAPADAVGRAFEVALMLASTGSVGEAPAHVAVLAQLLSVPPAEQVGIASLALAEQATATVRAHADWIAWLVAPSADPPAAFLAATAADRASAAAVRAVIDPSVCPVLARFDPATQATIIALLHGCGVRSPAAMVSAIVTARLPAVLAEARHHRAGALRDYPIGAPPFAYVEDDDG